MQPKALEQAGGGKTLEKVAGLSPACACLNLKMPSWPGVVEMEKYCTIIYLCKVICYSLFFVCSGDLFFGHLNMEETKVVIPLGKGATKCTVYSVQVASLHRQGSTRNQLRRRRKNKEINLTISRLGN